MTDQKDTPNEPTTDELNDYQRHQIERGVSADIGRVYVEGDDPAKVDFYELSPSAHVYDAIRDIRFDDAEQRDAAREYAAEFWAYSVRLAHQNRD